MELYSLFQQIVLVSEPTTQLFLFSALSVSTLRYLLSTKQPSEEVSDCLVNISLIFLGGDQNRAQKQEWILLVLVHRINSKG